MSNQLSVREARRQVRVKWPRAYCRRDSGRNGRFYVFGNPKRDPFGVRYKHWKQMIGDDMLSAGESEREAWNEAL